MTRTLATIVVACIALAIATAGSGAPPASFQWGTSNGGSINNPVEQQSDNWWNFNCANWPGSVPVGCDPSLWTFNPTGCNWDVDDIHYIGGGGDIASGASLPVGMCLIADGSSTEGNYYSNKTVQGSILSPSGNLTVTLRNSQGGSWTAVPIYYRNNHRWLYLICTVDTTGRPYTDWAATYPPVPGSNIGRGIRVDYTLTVASSQKAKATGELRIQGGGCS